MVWDGNRINPAFPIKESEEALAKYGSRWKLHRANLIGALDPGNPQNLYSVQKDKQHARQHAHAEG